MRRLAIVLPVCGIAALTIYCGEDLPQENEPPADGSSADVVTGDASSDDTTNPPDTGPRDPCKDPPPAGTKVVEATSTAPSFIVTDGFQLFWAGKDRVEWIGLDVDAGITPIGTQGTVKGIALTETHLVILDGEQMIAVQKGTTAPLLDYGGQWLPPVTAHAGYGMGTNASSVRTFGPPLQGVAANAMVTSTTAIALYETRLAWVAIPSGALTPALQTKIFNAVQADTLDAGASTPRRIALDSTRIYAADDNGRILSIDIAKKNRIELASGQSTEINSLRGFGDYVYFASPAGVSRVLKSGGCVERVAAGPAKDVAIGSGRVFWVNGVDVRGAPLP